jgi:hypothetical protein
MADDLAAPTGDLAAPMGDMAAPTGDMAAPTGDMAAPMGDLAAPTGDLASSDLAVAPGDLAGARDLAMPDLTPAPVQCGNMTCQPGQLCCVTLADGGAVTSSSCASSCADAGFPVACAGPQNCSANARYCCATAVTGAGMFPNCATKSFDTMCVPTCNTALTFSCNTTQIVRVCVQGADCTTDVGAQNCCDIAGGRGCVSNVVRAFITGGGGNCYP